MIISAKAALRASMVFGECSQRVGSADCNDLKISRRIPVFAVWVEERNPSRTRIVALK